MDQKKPDEYDELLQTVYKEATIVRSSDDVMQELESFDEDEGSEIDKSEEIEEMEEIYNLSDNLENLDGEDYDF
jgi:ribosomal 50S subunit-associated protein YjgA (DUF615 family)